MSTRKASIKDQEAIEQRVMAVMDDLIEQFKLDWWRVRVRFDPRIDGDERVVCDTTADWEYRQVGFVWSLFQLPSLTDEELHAIAVHEIVHMLMSPIWNELSEPQQTRLHKNNELATENIARVISHVLKAAD